MNFLVSFLFFFFIFFINQILLLVQEIALKSVDVKTIIVLVICAIPQFLQYVVPFATLSASSMILGDLGASNELMALRSSGIALYRVYRVLIFCSVFLSIFTYYISDYLMPLSSRVYQQRLGEVMRQLPTFELSPDSTNTIADVVMRNGEVSGSTVSDILLFTTEDSPYMTISSPEGSLELIDSTRFIYELNLASPQILMTEDDISRAVSAKGDSASVFLDFSSQVPSLTDTNPSNLSNSELWPLMMSRKEIRDENVRRFHEQREESLMSLAGNLKRIESIDVYHRLYEDLEVDTEYLNRLGEDEPVQFYYQYYSAEFNKKFALAFGCIALTVVTLPLSLIKIRHGRLVGFGLSLLIAVSYWYILFVSQLKIFDYSFNAGFLMYIPDAVMLIAGSAMLIYRKRRVG